MRWEEPRRTPIGRDGAGQAIALIEFPDPDQRPLIDIAGTACIALTYVDPRLVQTLRDCIARPRLVEAEAA